ncbi:MAG TPA: glycosyltransferase family 9 protein, partial [Vicinamibacterales bacterium]|nr:glycosyltransferase family 9 protein [Vicinamibacterales bacterium]
MLHINDRRERWLVRAADAALGVVSRVARPLARRREGGPPQRILLLRLERIGDLVMALPAVRDVRTLAPEAEIDLVVGSWNADLARAIPHVDAVVIADAAWLAREREGNGTMSLVAQARRWRPRRYDLAINFEPDIRSNLMIAASGAARTVGWSSGGGGPVLDVALDYDPSAHTSANARRLVAAAFGRTAPESARPLLTIPDTAAAAAGARLRQVSGRPLIGVHVSGGRPIKQWPVERFAAVAAQLADRRGAAIVATGSAADRPLVDAFMRALAPRSIVDLSGGDSLVDAAALIARLDLLVTGDTGPMHLASAVGTPVVAVFGPSDPARYAPRGPRDRIVRIDLPCSPCNRIRLPPARCAGHTPDCLSGVAVQQVLDAAL